MQRYTVTTLDSGERVVSERVSSVRSVSIGIWIGAGSRDETPSQAGMSHLIEHLLFKGSARYSTVEIAQIFDGLGGELNAATAREYTVGYGLTRSRLAALRPGTPICHPGPMNRGLEISAEAADAASSLVLSQVAAGVAVRMAVLYELLGGADEMPLTRVREGVA